MGHSVCCVVNCKNNGVNSRCKFYSFPTAKYKLEQRKKWIAAVKRINPNGSTWRPKLSNCICSAHFVGNEKSNEESSPSYIPTIFPSTYRVKSVDQVGQINRHSRFMKRRNKKLSCLETTVKEEQQINNKAMKFDIADCDTVLLDSEIVQTSNIKYADKECQVHIIMSDSVSSEKSFTCNRYISNSTHNDVEIQTEISEDNSVIIIPNQKKFKDKKCGTPQKTYVDQSVGHDIEDKVTTPQNFAGILSVKNDEQLLDLAGVTFNNFNFLLSRLSDNTAENSKIFKENKLFIFLLKIKTGLTFSAISVLFSVHRTTISRIFFSTLEELSSATEDLVFWTTKDIVEGTMPQCFYPDYINTRVIIDCTEFRIEVPASVDNRVYTYSHYKKGFTAKLLIGITPGGFISFKSKVAGARKSDSQMTIESGLINLLEDGDTVLAVKGFPEIRRTIDESGKKVVLVMPPFLERKEQFAKDETEATYSVAKVRIHVERIMQRLRTYQILSKIPEHFFHCIDSIVHICCVLVNLQRPIIACKKTDDKK